MYLCTKHERECVACGHRLTLHADRCPNCHANIQWHEGTRASCLYCASDTTLIVDTSEFIVDTRGVLNERIKQTLVYELSRYFDVAVSNIDNSSFTPLKDAIDTEMNSANKLELINLALDDPLPMALVEFSFISTTQESRTLNAFIELARTLIQKRYGKNTKLILAHEGIFVAKMR